MTDLAAQAIDLRGQFEQGGQDVPGIRAIQIQGFGAKQADTVFEPSKVNHAAGRDQRARDRDRAGQACSQSQQPLAGHAGLPAGGMPGFTGGARNIPVQYVFT